MIKNICCFFTYSWTINLLIYWWTGHEIMRFSAAAGASCREGQWKSTTWSDHFRSRREQEEPCKLVYYIIWPCDSQTIVARCNAFYCISFSHSLPSNSFTACLPCFCAGALLGTISLYILVYCLILDSAITRTRQIKDGPITPSLRICTVAHTNAIYRRTFSKRT